MENLFSCSRIQQLELDNELSLNRILNGGVRKNNVLVAAPFCDRRDPTPQEQSAYSPRQPMARGGNRRCAARLPGVRPLQERSVPRQRGTSSEEHTSEL